MNFLQVNKQDAGDEMSDDDDGMFKLDDMMNGPDEREDIAYAELMLAEFDQQPFFHKYWGRRRTEPFKHSSKTY